MTQTCRIPVIDFLRGLSCLGVLLYHVRVELWIGWWRITSYPHEYSSFAKAMELYLDLKLLMIKEIKNSKNILQQQGDFY